MSEVVSTYAQRLALQNRALRERMRDIRAAIEEALEGEDERGKQLNRGQAQKLRRLAVFTDEEIAAHGVPGRRNRE